MIHVDRVDEPAVDSSSLDSRFPRLFILRLDFRLSTWNSLMAFCFLGSLGSRSRPRRRDNDNRSGIRNLLSERRRPRLFRLIAPMNKRAILLPRVPSSAFCLVPSSSRFRSFRQPFRVPPLVDTLEASAVPPIGRSFADPRRERTCVRLQVTHLTRSLGLYTRARARACYFTCLIDRREKSSPRSCIPRLRVLADFSYSGNVHVLANTCKHRPLRALPRFDRPIEDSTTTTLPVLHLVSSIVSRYSRKLNVRKCTKSGHAGFAIAICTSARTCAWSHDRTHGQQVCAHTDITKLGYLASRVRRRTDNTR